MPTKSDWMLYESHRHRHYLLPDVWENDGATHLVGVKMFDMHGHYVGFWQASSMPRNLIKRVLAYHKATGHLTDTPVGPGDWGDPYQR